MRFRASILCLLLLSQPLSTFASVWHSDDVDAQTAGHCDAEVMVEPSIEIVADLMTEHHQPATGEDHSDCSNSCDLCAACAAVVAELLVLEQLHARPVNSLDIFLVMPSGKTNHPYRPPILS
ncbi:MAG: hypothetical protein GY727_14925 [Gammaproteobacteria bacterium]|nr:hypothetical protein [Gammaproteobacteria bacterium]MCP4089263.1 hypothetical protein [Gammaproteobacteria bacterium]MCP4275313.1 hypothetical protein [Gammaproteobacteria bacterium]MCP4830903.1 hypothetical protein [Gammaproteobacteria bacterium]MCP4929522.1 hypothetical protein [Gammaproteobacteria bacterium]